MKLKKIKKTIGHQPFENNTYLDKRIGFWGTVVEVNATTNTVNVLADTKQTFYEIPVVSTEWVCDKDNFVTGCRNLPPIGARVFVLMPTHTIVGSFVLCSGFSRGDTVTHTFFEKDKANELLKKTQSGWDIKENYDTGEISFISPDNEINFSVNLTDQKQIKLCVKENEILIDNKGLFFANSIQLKTNKGSLEIGNSIATLGSLISELLTILSNLSIIGNAVVSPDPAFLASLETLKIRWEQIFK